jgi:hypothetical protein
MSCSASLHYRPIPLLGVGNDPMRAVEPPFRHSNRNAVMNLKLSELGLRPGRYCRRRQRYQEKVENLRVGLYPIFRPEGFRET